MISKLLPLGLALLATSASANGSPSIADVCHRVSPRLDCQLVNVNPLFQVRIGTQLPENSASIGDILFVHGFGDRLDNHEPLFEQWNRAGYRVISFDLPGHGQDQGILNNINDWSFEQLAGLVAAVEKQTRVIVPAVPAAPADGANRPLVLSGWSTGGLLVTRMVQGLLFSQLDRPVSGMILYAPGIAVRPPTQIGAKDSSFMDGLIGHVTLESLTHDPHPDHNGPISPESPVTQVSFGITLMANSALAQAEPFPTDIPTLVFIGGEEEDHYADSKGLQKWVAKQQSRQAEIYEIDCVNGRHELDNEAFPMGQAVRQTSARFLELLQAGHPETILANSGSCHF